MDVLPILEELNTALPPARQKTLRTELARYLNELLLHDFSALVQLLYRVDVSEKKLKNVLKENSRQDAGELMADLLIQRQQEKKAARKSFQTPAEGSEEERW